MCAVPGVSLLLRITVSPFTTVDGLTDCRQLRHLSLMMCALSTLNRPNDPDLMALLPRNPGSDGLDAHCVLCP